MDGVRDPNPTTKRSRPLLRAADQSLETGAHDRVARILAALDRLTDALQRLGTDRVRRIVLDGKTNEWVRTEGFLRVDLKPVLEIYGVAGERYRIEARDRLGQGDWAAVAEVTIVESPEIWVDRRKDGAGQRIYRAVKE